MSKLVYNATIIDREARTCNPLACLWPAVEVCINWAKKERYTPVSHPDLIASLANYMHVTRYCRDISLFLTDTRIINWARLIEKEAKIGGPMEEEDRLRTLNCWAWLMGSFADDTTTRFHYLLKELGDTSNDFLGWVLANGGDPEEIEIARKVATPSVPAPATTDSGEK
ncbi:hypothetical protein ADUPG1_006261 [Aduncisulcus paluster]|uniref:Uncharacterized protein n=1 Tax=Aduncisulcus paluster TaxID=2918883 RepID=A0ABQ5KHG6_9EUKA|nr:hypothetical protein ADUPG1_006261 [Aduncisulcus paluster]